MDEKFLRVVSTSLIGYGTMLDQISSLENEEKRLKVVQKGQELHTKLITNAKFWKLAHHTNVSV